MTITLILMGLLMATFAGWLFSRSIHVRPWVAETGPPPVRIPAAATAPRVGLAAFLAVVTSVFALSISAYLMRMEMGGDWRSLPVPGLLWANTVLLVLASLALQVAWWAARDARSALLHRALAAGGLLTLAFVIGQGVVWQRLASAGFYLAENPANAFFYLLTGLHAAHLLGGLLAWARVVSRARDGVDSARLCAGVELCALYWHFLLLVWALVFGLVLAT
jgi:cytochrome c oxidase subunit III